jgi:5-methylcytosine-specific restriction endonuclease McrA
LNVDHIKPRRRFPELSLDPDNLQVLCGNCNTGKGSWDTTDWRKERVDPEIAADIEHLSLLRESGLLN